MATAIRPIDGSDVVRWPDGTWCYAEDLHEYSWMSDDYEVLTPEHPEYDMVAADAGPVVP